jgi:hypothetical protein
MNYFDYMAHKGQPAHSGSLSDNGATMEGQRRIVTDPECPTVPVNPRCCRKNPCEHPGIGPCDMPAGSFGGELDEYSPGGQFEWDKAGCDR